MKELSKQDPNFRAKVQDFQRLNSVRLDLALQVYKALSILIKSADYKLVSCSLLDKMDPDYSAPSKEFRFLFVKETDESENPN